MALKQYEYRAVLALSSREMMPALFSTTKLASYEALPLSPILRFLLSRIPMLCLAPLPRRFFEARRFVYLDHVSALALRALVPFRVIRSSFYIYAVF
jgi:hypothetical protein